MTEGTLPLICFTVRKKSFKAIHIKADEDLQICTDDSPVKKRKRRESRKPPSIDVCASIIFPDIEKAERLEQIEPNETTMVLFCIRFPSGREEELKYPLDEFDMGGEYAYDPKKNSIFRALSNNSNVSLLDELPLIERKTIAP